jgi:monovalent cation:H+ antiporter-2, CPA2 family
VVIGPGRSGLIENVGQVETLADIGLVLLLFTIGIEFSLETIPSMQRRILLAGFLQVVLTTVAVVDIASARGASPRFGRPQRRDSDRGGA